MNANKIIKVSDLSKEDIGKVVYGYNCEAGKYTCRIFHIENNRVYIITDDYIPFSVVPKGKKGTPIDKMYDFRFVLKTVKDDYVGASDITDPEIRDLNKMYFETFGDSSTSDIMKAIAYMLDTNVWYTFKNEKAEFAIGAPTIEMIVNSYNLTREDDEEKLKLCIKDDGYAIKFEDEGIFLNFCFNIDSYNDLYWKKSIKKAFSTWVASPSLDIEDIYTIGYSGLDIENGFVDVEQIHGFDSGFRPVISILPDTLLKETEDGFVIL